MTRTREQVAALLPAHVAAHLLGCPPFVQAAVVDVLGDILERWENAGILFDPVQLDAIIESITEIVVSYTVAVADHIRGHPLRWGDAG